MASIIPMPYLNQASQGTYNAMSDQIKKDRAYTALRDQYGPMAGDPQSALQLQQHGYNEQLNPLKLENQRVTNNALQNQTDYLEQAYPGMLENQQLANKGQGLTNALNTQKISQNDFTMGQQQGAQRVQLLQAGLSNLETALQGVEDPTMRGALFDQEVKHLAPLLGANEAEIGQALDAQRQAIVSQGAGAIPIIRADLNGLTATTTTPEDQLKMDKTRAEIAKINADIGKIGTEQDANRLDAANKAMDAVGEITKKQVALEQLQRRVSNVARAQTTPDGTAIPSKVDQARELLAKVSKDANIRAWNTSDMNPFRFQTPEYQFKILAGEIGDNLSLDDVRNVKQFGVTFGNMTVREFSAAGESFANLDITQSPTRLGNLLSQIEHGYNAMDASMTNELGAMETKRQRLQKQADKYAATADAQDSPTPELDRFLAEQGPDFQTTPQGADQVPQSTAQQQPNQQAQPPDQQQFDPGTTGQVVVRDAPIDQTSVQDTFTSPAATIPWPTVESNLPALADKYGIGKPRNRSGGGGF